MTHDLQVTDLEIRARADVAAERACLRCRTVFWGEGFGQRICARCKSTVSWRSAAPASGGQGGHRSAGRSS